MGMDLEPINPTKDAPRYPADDKYSPNQVIWGRYNWAGWQWICTHLEKWGVRLVGFSGSNDGDEISAAKCREVADAIEQHISELDADYQNWLKPHIALWRTCGGYRQF